MRSFPKLNVFSKSALHKFHLPFSIRSLYTISSQRNTGFSTQVPQSNHQTTLSGYERWTARISRFSIIVHSQNLIYANNLELILPMSLFIFAIFLLLKKVESTPRSYITRKTWLYKVQELCHFQSNRILFHDDQCHRLTRVRTNSFWDIIKERQGQGMKLTLVCVLKHAIPNRLTPFTMREEHQTAAKHRIEGLHRVLMNMLENICIPREL